MPLNKFLLFGVVYKISVSANFAYLNLVSIDFLSLCLLSTHHLFGREHTKRAFSFAHLSFCPMTLQRGWRACWGAPLTLWLERTFHFKLKYISCKSWPLNRPPCQWGWEVKFGHGDYKARSIARNSISFRVGLGTGEPWAVQTKDICSRLWGRDRIFWQCKWSKFCSVFV